jgi:UDP-N-acetylglucosamine 2-epimerase (non-hydrolysing)
MIKTIEESNKNDTLKMEAPDEVMSSFIRRMKIIDNDISVNEFEKNNNALVKIAFEGEEIRFPYDDLNLNGLTIIYEDYNNSNYHKQEGNILKTIEVLITNY